QNLGVRVRIVREMVHPMRPWRDAKALAALMRLMREERPDIVHAHTSKAGLLARLAGYLMGIPVVFTVHAWSFVDGAPLLQKWASIPLERVTGALGGFVIAVSQANADLGLRRKVTRPARLQRIWNGVADVPMRARHAPNETVTLMMTARFCEPKDHVLLLRA